MVNAVYAEALRQFSVRSPDGLMNAQCPHKWWSRVTTAFHPITGGKQSTDPVDLPSTCLLSPSLTTVAFMLREVKRLLLDLDSYGGTDPLGIVESR